jgi:Flp pilus assembly protein TadD
LNELIATIRPFLLATALGLTGAIAQSQEPAAAAPPATTPSPAAAAAPSKARPALRVLRTGGLKVESAALLLSGQQGGPLPIAVLSLPLPSGSDRMRVPVLVEISGRSLLARPAAEEEADPLLRVDIAVYALGEQGMVAGSLADTVEIDLERLETELGKAGLRFWGELSLMPGTYSLRVLARRHGSANDLGLRSLSLVVPAKSASALLTPFVQPRGESSWVTVRASSGNPAESLASPLSLLSRDGFPEARPVVPSPGAATIEIPAAGLPDGAEGLVAELRQEGQPTVTEMRITLGDRNPTGVAGLELIAGRLSVPSLPPGEYQLRVKNGDMVSPPLAVQIAAPEGLPESWAAAGEGGREDPADEQRAEGRKGRLRRGEVAEFERSYRAALLSLSAGDLGGARTALAVLENSLLDRPQPIPLEEVADLEIRVLRRIGKDDPEALLPILDLYGESYRESVRQRAFQRSTHARQLLLSLADYYGNRSKSPEGKKAMSRFLVAFAAELARGQEPGGASAWAWKRTLDIDPDDEIALLCLAIDAEKRGAYREALPFLDRLRASHPESREGTLRLATVQSRLGNDRRARELFASLAGPAATDWIADLALQEIARLQLAAGKVQEAEKGLKAAVARFPGDEKLTLMLASALDRQGRKAEARDLLASFKPAAPTAQGARLRYSDLPEEALRKAHEEFSRVARPQLASLTKILGDGARLPNGGVR